MKNERDLVTRINVFILDWYMKIFIDGEDD